MNGKTIFDKVEILDQNMTFSLHEVCERGGVRTEFVADLVEHGIITPIKDNPGPHWVFDSHALSRLRRAQRLQHDLKINLPGLALSLELLDDLSKLRHQVAVLNQQLEQLLDWGKHE